MKGFFFDHLLSQKVIAHNATVHSHRSLSHISFAGKKINENESIQGGDEIVIHKIYLIRNEKVMLDRDLTELYGVETKRLKEAVRRNISRFPANFMFEMSETELNNWRTHFASSNSEKMGLRHTPFCFTEQGVAMLSSVLNSPKAIEANIQIIRVFTRLRKAYLDTTELQLAIEAIRKKTDNNTKNIEIIFSYPDELIEKNKAAATRKKIGYVLPKTRKRVVKRLR